MKILDWSSRQQHADSRLQQTALNSKITQTQETKPLLMMTGISWQLQNYSVRQCCIACRRDRSLVTWHRTCYNKRLDPVSKTPAATHETTLKQLKPSLGRTTDRWGFIPHCISKRWNNSYLCVLRVSRHANLHI